MCDTSRPGLGAAFLLNFCYFSLVTASSNLGPVMGPHVLIESCASGVRNSLSNSPCPLGRARGRGRYILLARAIKNKPFQCSDGCDSQQRRRTAARVEQGDLFGITAIATLERFVLYCSCKQNISAAPPGAARARGIAQAVTEWYCA